MRVQRMAVLCLLFGIFLSHPIGAADKLVGIHSAIAISQSLPWIAREAGIFRKNNLDFDLVLMRSAATAAAAMVGGETDVGLIGRIGIVSAYVQGAHDFVIVGAVKNILTHSIIAKPEIKRPEELKGKRIGVNRIGSNNHYFAIQVLQRFGLDPVRDVIFRQTGGDAADLIALLNGSVDASAMLTYGQNAIAQGFHYLIYGPDLRIPYAAAAFTTRRSVIARRPQVIGQFMRSMAEASKIFHLDRDLTFKVLTKHLRINDRKILETSYNNEVKAMEPRFDVRPEALQAILDELATNDARAKKIQPQQLIDRRYIEEMEKSGFFDSLWGTKR
jgi:ABC-type nitrate/sulfonate/bicarbonate transport system substrate-binding protein